MSRSQPQYCKLGSRTFPSCFLLIVVWQIGQRNNAVEGVAQISDMVITTNGGSVGAIAIEWNLAGAAGDVGMWASSQMCCKRDTMVINLTGCPCSYWWCTGYRYSSQPMSSRWDDGYKLPGRLPWLPHWKYWLRIFRGILWSPKSWCFYFSHNSQNVWVWTADHDLDDPSEGRINAFSPRGILVDHSVEPIWLVGTASEHHVSLLGLCA